MSKTESGNDKDDNEGGPSRPSRRVRPEIEDRIEELSAYGLAAKQIHQTIAMDPELAEHCPDVRTIQRRLHVARDESGRWALTEGTIEESTAVLAVLQDIIEATNGAVTWVTRAEAKMLGRVVPVTGGLRGWGVYLIARAYAHRQAVDRSTNDLDAMLVYQPWRSIEASRAYARAVALGHIPAGPEYLNAELRVSDRERSAARPDPHTRRQRETPSYRLRQ